MGRHSKQLDWKKYFRRTMAVGAAGVVGVALVPSDLTERIFNPDVEATGELPVFPKLDFDLDAPTQAIPGIAQVAEQQAQVPALPIGNSIAQALPNQDEIRDAATPTVPTPVVPPARRPQANTNARINTPVADAEVGIAVGGGSIASIAVELAALPTPYVYGGKSLISGIDCSGFVWEVLKRAGLNVPYRNSAALKAWAIPVKDPKPGDLAFWPGHVAIYIGNGKVADAGNPLVDTSVRLLWGSPTYGRVPGR